METREVTRVESEEELAKPGVLTILEGVEDRVEEELAKVIDGFTEEGSDGEVVCAFLLLFGGEIRDVYTGEVEEGILIVRCKLQFGLGIY